MIKSKHTFFNIMNCACQIIDIFQKIAAFCFLMTHYHIYYPEISCCFAQKRDTISQFSPLSMDFSRPIHTAFRPTFRTAAGFSRCDLFPVGWSPQKMVKRTTKNPPQIPLSLFKSSLDITVIFRVYFASVDGAVEIWVEPVRYRL